MKIALAIFAVLAACSGCGDNWPPEPVPCGRYDLNVKLECAIIPGEYVDPVFVATDAQSGVSYVIVNDCETQCSLVHF